MGWFRAFLILLRRNGLNYARNPGNLSARIMMITIVAFLTGGAFRHVTSGGQQKDIISLGMYHARIMSSLTMTMIILALLPLTSISLFIHDRQFFHKESRAKLYPVSAYFLSNVLLELCVNVVNGVIFGVVTWWMEDFSYEDGVYAFEYRQFFIFLALCVGISNLGCMQAITFSLIAPSKYSSSRREVVVVQLHYTRDIGSKVTLPNLSYALSPSSHGVLTDQDLAFAADCGYVAIALLTSGAIITDQFLADHSVFLSWIKWLSSYRYCWRALVRTN